MSFIKLKKKFSSILVSCFKYIYKFINFALTHLIFLKKIFIIYSRLEYEHKSFILQIVNKKKLKINCVFEFYFLFFIFYSF